MVLHYYLTYHALFLNEYNKHLKLIFVLQMHQISIPTPEQERSRWIRYLCRSHAAARASWTLCRIERGLFWSRARLHVCDFSLIAGRGEPNAYRVHAYYTKPCSFSGETLAARLRKHVWRAELKLVFENEY